MAEIETHVTPECLNCGAQIPILKELPDDAVLVCQKCGKGAGTYRDFKAHARKAAADAVAAAIAKKLSNFGD
jgi:hypothetical protein